VSSHVDQAYQSTIDNNAYTHICQIKLDYITMLINRSGTDLNLISLCDTADD